MVPVYQGPGQSQGQGILPGPGGPGSASINQSRNSVKFASPVRYSANRWGSIYVHFVN